MSEPKKYDASGIVLLIEDNPVVADVVRGMLQELGFEVKSAGSVEDALQLLHTDSIRLVVSDIELPGALDGLALARDLKEAKPDLPLILMTGHAQKANTAAADFEVLLKPFGVGDLGQALARTIPAMKHA